MTARPHGGCFQALKWAAASALTLLSLGLECSAAALRPSQTAYITIEGTGVISGIDTGSLQIVRHIDIGGRPHNLEVTVDGLLVVATQGTHAVAVIDPKTDPVIINRINLGAPPHDLALDADGRTALVVSERGLLARFDLRLGRVLQKTELKGRPHNLVVWRESAWITDISAPRLFVVAGESVQQLPISIEGHDLAIRPGSDELWVTPWSSDRTIIIDLNSRRETAGLRVGRTLSHKHLAFTGDGGEAWITEPESGSLFVINARTRKVVERVDLRGHPHHVRFAAERAYVAVGPRELVLLEITTHSIISRVVMGSEVHDVGISPSR